MPAMPTRVATVGPARSDRSPVNSRQPRPAVAPLPGAENFKHQVYAALKNAIAAMDIYGSRSEIRLDERGLAEDFGVSRTPVREAMAQLEREGMAARLVTQTAGDKEIAALRRMFATFEDGEVRAHLDEYSEINIEFHQALVRMSGNTTLVDLAENLFTHMRMIRRKTIGERDRADRSI